MHMYLFSLSPSFRSSPLPKYVPQINPLSTDVLLPYPYLRKTQPSHQYHSPTTYLISASCIAPLSRVGSPCAHFA